MTVKELIEELQKYPDSASLHILELEDNPLPVFYYNENLNQVLII